MAKIRKTDSCWIWTGATNWKGYGTFGMNGTHWIASRAAYHFFKGNIPEGMFVCHRCDNPPCCNPAHLFIGTVLDNKRDALSKGRKQGRNKRDLNSPRYAEIRALRKSGMPRGAIALRFNLNERTIYKICHDLTPRHRNPRSIINSLKTAA